MKLLHTHHYDFCSFYVKYMKYRGWLKFCVNYVFAAFICIYKRLITDCVPSILITYINHPTLQI